VREGTQAGAVGEGEAGFPPSREPAVPPASALLLCVK